MPHKHTDKDMNTHTHTCTVPAAMAAPAALSFASSRSSSSFAFAIIWCSRHWRAKVVDFKLRYVFHGPAALSFASSRSFSSVTYAIFWRSRHWRATVVDFKLRYVFHGLSILCQLCSLIALLRRLMCSRRAHRSESKNPRGIRYFRRSVWRRKAVCIRSVARILCIFSIRSRALGRRSYGNSDRVRSGEEYIQRRCRS